MHRRATWYWTAPEIAIVRAHYATGGIDACIALLPNRSRSTIYQKANALGLRAPGQPQVRLSWPKDDAIDRKIMDLHTKALAKGDVREFAASIGRPVWWVSKRARELGYVTPRFAEAPWSDDEIEILNHWQHLGLPNIRKKLGAAGFKRSDTAIHVKRKRLGLMRSDNGYYNANQVAELLGVDQKTVSRWIELHQLSAKRRGEFWDINVTALRIFLLANPYAVPLRKIPAAHQAWFIELLCGRALKSQAA